MSWSKAVKLVKKLHRRVQQSLYPFVSSAQEFCSRVTRKVQLGVTKPQILAYQLFGERTTQVLPLFKDVDVNLRRAGMRISFKAYVSLTVLTSLFIPAIFLVLVPLILSSIFHFSFLSSILFGIGGSLLAGALTVIVFYVYPIYRADSLRRTLEDELPFTAGYMAILAGAGVPPDLIFRSLAKVDAPLAVSGEAKIITRDVELFGNDIISALNEASKRSPSEEFKDLLEGFITTMHSGGKLVEYLTDRSNQFMRLKRISLRRFSDTLAILSEVYVALLIAGPLLLVVMLAVIAMLGGGLGFATPSLLLQLLTYIAIPVASIIFLVILDAVSPKW
jgi:flagellar protein FlaJ